MERRVQPGAGVGEVGVAAARDGEPLAQRAAPRRACRCRRGRTATSARRRRRRRSRARARRRGRRRRPGRRRAARGRRARRARRGRPMPLTQPTCEHATRRVRGPTASASSASGTSRISTPRSSRAAPSAPSRPGCSSSLVRISSPRASSRPATACADALGGAGRERDVAGLAAERARVGGAQLVGQLAAALEVRLGAAAGAARARARRARPARRRQPAGRRCRR